MSFHVPDAVAIHEILPYAHGLYPFVELARERTTRPLLESRGVPEICQTAQNEIKTQRDFRVDAASLSVLPPVRVPANRGKFDLVLGPGVQIPERRQGEVSFMEPPRVSQGSIEVEAATRLDVDNYFGRMSQGVPPQLAMLHTQELIDTWLLDMKLCVVQTMALAQQYMTPEEVARVTGNQLPSTPARRTSAAGLISPQNSMLACSTLRHSAPSSITSPRSSFRWTASVS
jgi:hypothetical protein